MRQIGRATFVVVTLALSASPLHAQTNNTVVVPRISAGEFNTLQSRQQRLNFQQQQQFNRQLDNLSNQMRQPRNQVPVMKPTCSPQKAGISC